MSRAYLVGLVVVAACGRPAQIAEPARLDETGAWSSLRSLLFRWRTTDTVSPCFSAETAGGVRCTEQRSALIQLGWPTREREQAEEGSVLLHHGVPYDLAAPERAAAIAAALGDATRAARQLARDVAVGTAATSRIVAGQLLQHDLWQLYDRLNRFASTAPELVPRFTELRAALVPLIRALALPAATLRGLPPNLPAIVRAHPDVAAALDTEVGWIETIQLPSDAADDDRSGATAHARATRYTSVFRVLVAPPDAAAFTRAMANRPTDVPLAPGTRLAIVETPLVIDDRGDIVALPIVTLVETAHTLDASVPLATLADLPFDVIELDHRSAAPQRLAPDALFPFGGALGGTPFVLPMRNACLSCHDPRASALKNAQLSEPNRMALAPDRDDQLRRIVAAKRASEEFAELRRAF